MGGKLLVLAGDFCQTLPIIPRGTRADEINASLKSSKLLWPHVQTLRLRKNMRVHMHNDIDAAAHANLLLSIGNGQIPVNPHNGLIRIPCGKLVYTLQQLLDSVFPELSQNFHNITWLSQRAILAPTNDTVDFINDKLLDNVGTHKQIYTSIDKTADVNDAVNYSTEFLNSLNSPGMPPHKLRLKIGSPIILLRNLDPPKLCNGTKLIIKQLRLNIIELSNNCYGTIPIPKSFYS